MKRNGFAPIIIIIVIALILIAGYFLTPASLKDSLFSKSPLASNAPIATVVPNKESFFTGKLTKLTQDLKLFKETEDMKLNDRLGGFAYYSAGQFTGGDLRGYTRIIATSPQNGPGVPPVYILATKDFNSYILDDPEGLTKLPDNDYQNPYSYLDETKVGSTAQFETDQPTTISLNNKFSLYMDSFLTASVPGTSKDKFDQVIYETILKTDFSALQKLASPNMNLSFYFEKPDKPANKYVLSDTKVIVVDSTGLPKVYSITTPKDANSYPAIKQKYDEDTRIAQAEHSSNFPTYPNPPHLGFASSDISGVSTTSFYTDYETAFPGACAFDLDSRVVNVQDSDLKQIGSAKGLDVFALKDASSELNTLQFDSKMSYYKDGGLGMTFEDVNKGVNKPSGVSDYASKNPLLFVKDYWGRWIALGEWDIKLPGGCGKPVIYLYPTHDMEVNLNFNAPVDFTTDIPTYSDSWKVLAHKDGSLTNLKPGLTDCSKFDGQTFGSEYAKDACLNNTYPYLYWSGNVSSVDFPKMDKGWVIGKSDLSNFIDSRLSFMGLNSKEKSDFESYWIPEMLKRNANFYRISFLSTGEVNQIFPMTVTPAPDTLFRTFLDWEPLNSFVPFIPQNLEQFSRNGFTMVEWGGLK